MKTINISLDFPDNKYSVIEKLANLFHEDESKDPFTEYIHSIIKQQVTVDLDSFNILGEQLSKEWTKEWNKKDE